MNENNDITAVPGSGPEKCILPALKTPDEKWMDELRPYFLDPRNDYPDPYYMLEYNGVPMSAFGGIQAVAGQKKNGKSFLMTQLMAAVLDAGDGVTDRHLPGLRVPERTIDWLGHKPSVLYIDTEMEQLYSARVLRRVHWLCGWDMREPHDRFTVLWLKSKNGEYEEKERPYDWRLRMMKLAVEVLRPDVVFIDGLRDIVRTINDEDVANGILDELGKMASERNMCIWCALHYNPRPGNDDPTKMRGWLGTELGDKANTVLVSVKHKDSSTGDVTFTVKQADTRDADMDDWKYQVTDEAGRLGVPRIIGGVPHDPTETVKGDSVDDIRRWIEAAKNMYEWPMSRSDVKRKVFGEIGGQKNNPMQDADLRIAMNTGMLEESILKKKGSYMLMPKDDLPF